MSHNGRRKKKVKAALLSLSSLPQVTFTISQPSPRKARGKQQKRKNYKDYMQSIAIPTQGLDMTPQNEDYWPSDLGPSDVNEETIVQVTASPRRKGKVHSLLSFFSLIFMRNSYRLSMTTLPNG